MEDLATDRIYRLMIAQRVRYPGTVHACLTDTLFDEELEALLLCHPEEEKRYRRAREISEEMILSGSFDPN